MVDQDHQESLARQVQNDLIRLAKRHLGLTKEQIQKTDYWTALALQAGAAYGLSPSELRHIFAFCSTPGVSQLAWSPELATECAEFIKTQSSHLSPKVGAGLAKVASSPTAHPLPVLGDLAMSLFPLSLGQKQRVNLVLEASASFAAGESNDSSRFAPELWSHLAAAAELIQPTETQDRDLAG